MTKDPTRPSRPCCSCASHAPVGLSASPLNRREFMFGLSALTVGGMVPGSPVLGRNRASVPPGRGALPTTPLRVQPVLTYRLPQRREATSWREWGGLQTQADVDQERERIGTELAGIQSRAEFPLEILPLRAVQSPEQGAAAAQGTHDALLMYAAGGGVNLLESLTVRDRWNLMFLRHQPGPTYLWYEIVHPRFLRKTVDEYGQPGMDVHDVVVDRYDDLVWRLRALHGLKNTLNKKIVAVGGPGGWGAGGRKAPETSRTLWKLDIQDYPYAELGPRLKRARQDGSLVQRCRADSERYLAGGSVELQTTRDFVANAFVLTEVLKDVLAESGTDAITINSCMGTIMPMSETTACLPLSLLNDEGYLAFCESDFVVIPSGILLHYISGTPVFLNDPTFPHDNVVTLAHCTAPRRMDGKNAEPARILTHFESDYGAAPKVEMSIGRECTNLIPDFACRKWVGFHGTIVANPFLDICRSQVDVRIDGDGAALLEEMKGFHWMMSYGDYLRETGYALRKLGIEFHDVSSRRSS